MSKSSEERRKDRKQAYLDMLEALDSKNWKDFPVLRETAFTVDLSMDIEEPINSIVSFIGSFTPNVTGPYAFVLQDTMRDYRDSDHICKTRESLLAEGYPDSSEEDAVYMFPYIK